MATVRVWSDISRPGVSEEKEKLEAGGKDESKMGPGTTPPSFDSGGAPPRPCSFIPPRVIFSTMAEESNRRLAAVWFADIVGYTALSEKNEDAALKLVAELQAVANREVAAHSGRVVKFVGDAVLAVFESAGSAVDAALALLVGFNQAAKKEGIEATLRLGVHVGEIHTADDGDVYGDGVNTASRIQGAAAPGQVYLSSFAYESVRHRRTLRTESVGKRRLKGLSRSMELFAAL
jgi:adenylate cyclase